MITKCVICGGYITPKRREHYPLVVTCCKKCSNANRVKNHNKNKKEVKHHGKS